ncbi:MAG: DUF3479 domain-containing protein, partial [Chloroflexi bacterium]|nr:DUF3479 domain-containing protein [Chloroflexota bacterium]
MTTQTNGTEPLRFVYITMDGGHNAAVREAARLLYEAHGVALHPSFYSVTQLCGGDLWDRFEADVQRADFVFGCMIFGEETVRPMQRILQAASAPVCIITSNPALIYCTRIGGLELKPPDENEEPGLLKKWMQRLRPKKGDGKSEAYRQTALVKNLTKLMKYVPGKMRDLHTFIAMHNYWLHSSPENLKRMMALLIQRYVPRCEVDLPTQDALEYPDAAIYHPDADAPFPDAASYRRWRAERGTPVDGADRAWHGSAGLLTQRAIILSENTPHLDALIRATEAQGIEVRTSYSAMLDFRPALTEFMDGDKSGLPKVDLVMNSMGFPLVGGPAGSRPDQAVEALRALDVGYLDLIPLGFQHVEEWQADEVGLNPMQVAMNIALPELDGGTEPVIYGCLLYTS